MFISNRCSYIIKLICGLLSNNAFKPRMFQNRPRMGLHVIPNRRKLQRAPLTIQRYPDCLAGKGGNRKKTREREKKKEMKGREKRERMGKLLRGSLGMDIGRRCLLVLVEYNTTWVALGAEYVMTDRQTDRRTDGRARAVMRVI